MFKKVKNWKDIVNDERIENAIRNYDGYGVHYIECKKGYRFSNFNSTIEHGNIKELCDSINEDLYKEND